MSEEKKTSIKTYPFLLELVEQAEGKVTYILRNPQSGMVVCLADSADELCQFLDEFIS